MDSEDGEVESAAASATVAMDAESVDRAALG